MAETLTTEHGPLIRLHPKRIISFGIDQPDADARNLTTNTTTPRIGKGEHPHLYRSHLPSAKSGRAPAAIALREPTQLVRRN